MDLAHFGETQQVWGVQHFLALEVPGGALEEALEGGSPCGRRREPLREPSKGVLEGGSLEGTLEGGGPLRESLRRDPLREGALEGGGPLRVPFREGALRLVLMLLLMLFVISMLISLSMPMSM